MIFCDPLCARFQISFYAQWSLLIFSTINPHLTEAHILTAPSSPDGPNPPSLLPPFSDSSLGLKTSIGIFRKMFLISIFQCFALTLTVHTYLLTELYVSPVCKLKLQYICLHWPLRVRWFLPGTHVYCFLTFRSDLAEIALVWVGR